VRGEELIEKLGRDELCPCGSGRRFQAVLSRRRPLLTGRCAISTGAS